MRQKYSIILLVGILLFTGCREEKKEQIPEGAFPIVYDGIVYIKGSVDSVNGNYAFDTGAENLYIDSTYYAQNKFSHKNTFIANLPGVGLTPQTVIVIRDSVEFKFDEYSYKTSIVPIIQLKPIIGDFADGIIGREYFSNSILEINYEMEYMKLYKSIDSIDVQGWSKIKLSNREKRLYLPLDVIINDSIKISGEYELDYGSGGGVDLTSLVAEKYNLSENINNKVHFFTKYGGIGGESSSYYFTASSLQIGDFKIDNVDASFSLDSTGAMASEKRLGILGHKIYDRFHVYIDFINNNLYLKPNKNFSKPFKLSRLGFTYVDRRQTLNSWIVTGLYSSSNAQKGGLQIDDKILAVNGISISEIPYELQKAYFDNIDEIILKIERGRNIIDISFTLKSILTR